MNALNLPKKRFTKLNESFKCEYCGMNVLPHPTSSRDHCNYCLHGKHVDINPGDRSNTCHGKLVPIGVEHKNGRQRIVYRCSKCQQVNKNIVAPDDDAAKIQHYSTLIWRD